MVTFSAVWNGHPYPSSPCDPSFANQCAIRMTVALHEAGLDTNLLTAVRCWHGHTKPRHILRAQEMATALANSPKLLGNSVVVAKMKGTINDNIDTFKNAKGIVFIQNGWGATDHIDIWDGSTQQMKGSSNSTSYMAVGSNVWLWKLA
jgi:hypothetical protein